METYVLEEKQYEIYRAASGDYCVSVEEYGKEREDYNVGSYTNALKFILSEFRVHD